MSKQTMPFRFVYRILQIAMALIPASIGSLGFLNDLSNFQGGVKNLVVPLVTMAGDTKNFTWRALPPSLAPYLYTLMFCAEFVTGILAVIGIVMMIKNFLKSSIAFERSKHWIYIACIWGTLVWGLGFFEGAGDWFLAWKSKNATISGLQLGALMGVIELFFVFFYLKYCRESDLELQ